MSTSLPQPATPTPTPTSTAPPAVEPLCLEDPVLRTIPFGLALPSSLSSFHNPNDIVGSIVVMGKKSAMVWVGWGLLDKNADADANANANAAASGETPANQRGFGTGTPSMGQLVVAMPRTDYRGAFSAASSSSASMEASCSQLVGSASSEDQMLANQMASRLSCRSGMAIYVSCQLSSGVGGSGSSGGMGTGHEADLLSQRAAALAEREVWRILQRERERV